MSPLAFAYLFSVISTLITIAQAYPTELRIRQGMPSICHPVSHHVVNVCLALVLSLNSAFRCVRTRLCDYLRCPGLAWCYDMHSRVYDVLVDELFAERL